MDSNPFDQFDAPPPQQSSSTAANPFDQFDSSPKPQTEKTPDSTSDIGKTLIGNVAPNAASNVAANLLSVPATVGSYALQAGTKGGEYLGEGLDSLYNMATGKPQKTQADYDQEQKDLMNAVRGKMGLDQTNSGDISGIVPTPSNLLNAGMNAMGTPLYQPKTEAGKQAETFGNIATAGAGTGVGAIPALMGAAGATAGQYGVKQAEGTQAEQFLASLAGGIGGGTLGSKTASDSITPEDQAIDTLGTKSTKNTFTHTSDTLRSMAQDAYANSKELGAEFDPEASASLPKAIDQSLATTGKMNDRLHGDTLSILGDMKNQADEGNLTLEDVHQYRQLFGDAVNNNLHPNGKMKPDAMKANQAINAIDDFLGNAQQNPDKLVSGSPEAIQAWQQGQDLWSASNRVNDIERIMQRAELMQNPATSMRQGFATLASNPKRMRGFTPDQQELIKDASQTNLGGEALRAIGSRLVSIASFGAHNPLAGLAAIPVSAAARNLQTMQQSARGQNIISNLTKDIPDQYSPLKATAKPDPLQLPSPAINVPAGGFGASSETQDVPEINYNQSQRSLPAPKEMSYEDMVKSGRALPSPDQIPINLSSQPVRATYNPNDLNRGDEIGFPFSKTTDTSTVADGQQSLEGEAQKRGLNYDGLTSAQIEAGLRTHMLNEQDLNIANDKLNAETNGIAYKPEGFNHENETIQVNNGPKQSDQNVSGNERLPSQAGNTRGMSQSLDVNQKGSRSPQPDPEVVGANLSKKINRDFPAATNEYNAIPDTRGGKILRNVLV